MDLDTLVFNFRKAIEAAKANNEPGEFFRKFPTGQCGTTSDILAQYLIDNGIGPIIYVCGTYYGDDYDNSQSHAWLDIDGKIIDITGDQFKYHKTPLKNVTPVYVGPMTDYYKQFEADPGSKCPHYGLQGSWYNYHELKENYKTILKYLCAT